MRYPLREEQVVAALYAAVRRVYGLTEKRDNCVINLEFEHAEEETRVVVHIRRPDDVCE